ncbi:hypothetical protein KS4_17660 [Poriferisphaera corsica]|uniref:Uncharacterized protein n=1 Tax=Poriferisphaera corsica TaxID=2528020 RepID=A0A517YU00_9BACT|nr:hypothetical protein KS4_17660 [Poriferisphaera corsica]
MDANEFEHGEVRDKFVVDPFGECFGCGIFQALNVVEAVVIELIDERGGDFFDVAEVHEVAHFRVTFAFDNDVDLEGVAMKTAAFVAVREFGEPMSGFEVNFFG